MKERGSLLARQVSQGREGAKEWGGEFAQVGQNQGLRSQIWGEKPPIQCF